MNFSNGNSARKLQSPKSKIKPIQRKNLSNNSYPPARKPDNGGHVGGVAVKTAKNCGFCDRGPHQVEDCWFKHPEKRPKPNNLNKQIFAMLETMVVGDNKLTMANCPVNNVTDPSSNYEYCCLLHTTSTIQCAQEDLILTNSNFINSGATIDAISPGFCRRVGLEKRMIDHGVEMPIILVNQQEMSVPKGTSKPRVESGNKDVNKPKTPKKKRINPRIANIPSSKAMKTGGQRFVWLGALSTIVVGIYTTDSSRQ
ncbi:hypothetical protein PHMEG_00016189 [Phytophthora megakarya]|uniref:Uncharacterized protein n=1 Tax=Phytophthora megakarya TaxID=4795 RepID=A0A225W1I3_9STRA|nr:hypothetical protein PHMEG_00016189 [Phytophthora megakarya]